MAAVQERNGSFQILFRYLGKQYTFTLGEVAQDEAETKGAVRRGFHVLRHSFISCLAAGVDQRIIDEFVGHQTDEQRRCYRHLIPDVKQKAITGVFGGDDSATS